MNLNLGTNSMKIIAVSGINLYEGGPLSVYYDFLDSIIASGYDKKYKIIAFVHRKQLFDKYEDKVQIVELPKSRRSYIHRLYYEFYFFKKISKHVDVDIWISLHDITPNVNARKVYTYCHNVSPFIEKNIKNIRYSFTNVVFSYLYKYIYRLNIKHATSIIVQTNWMRNAFLKMYPIKNVIVAKPDIKIDYQVKKISRCVQKKRFIFPAFPRYFKNFEIICEAAREIDATKAEIILTLDGSENAYSRALLKKYSDVKSISWIGLQSREKIYELYNDVDCLIFPSMMETWGLPISEFKITQKDMIIIDLPYARETLGEYMHALFFKPKNVESLRERILSVIENRQMYSATENVQIAPPVVTGWKALIELISK